VIISHEHKFIFLKTKKTAGTSIELALSQLCGPDDIIAPITEGDEVLGAPRRIYGTAESITGTITTRSPAISLALGMRLKLPYSDTSSSAP